MDLPFSDNWAFHSADDLTGAWVMISDCDMESLERREDISEVVIARVKMSWRVGK
jgi:hypothetical protein